MKIACDKKSRARIPAPYRLSVGVITLIGVMAAAFATRGAALAAKPDRGARLGAAKQLVGKEVFACQTAELYKFKPKSPRGLPIGAKIPYFPLLAPLEIVGVAPSVSSNLVQGLLVIVKAPNQKEMVFKADLPLTGPLLQGRALLKELASGGFGGLMPEIPRSFSPDQVESIRYGVVTKGMTEEEVTCALGFPESTNDYGQGGKQLVYLGGRELIYLDSGTGRVTDIQHFEQ